MRTLTRRVAIFGGMMTVREAMAGSGARLYRVAGTGEAGFDGDGGLASQARLNGPAGLGFDPQGNLFIADLKNSAIRRVDARTQHITTVAGTGVAGFAGDGGPAAHAQLMRPEGVAADKNGNVYIADSGNDRIRRINPQGHIDTIAGGGTEDPRRFDGPARRVRLAHPAGVVVDGDGTVFFNDYGHDIICAVTPDGALRRVAGTDRYGYSGDDGPAREATLNDVYGIGLDAHGALYICDSLNFAIRKVEHGVISTVVRGLAGVAHAKGTIGAKVPHGVDVDAEGAIFVADTGGHRLRRYHGDNDFVIAGNGEPGHSVEDGTPALSAAIDIHGVRLSPDGTAFFVDFSHHNVWRLAGS